MEEQMIKAWLTKNESFYLRAYFPQEEFLEFDHQHHLIPQPQLGCLLVSCPAQEGRRCSSNLSSSILLEEIFHCLNVPFGEACSEWAQHSAYKLLCVCFLGSKLLNRIAQQSYEEEQGIAVRLLLLSQTQSLSTDLCHERYYEIFRSFAVVPPGFLEVLFSSSPGCQTVPIFWN